MKHNYHIILHMQIPINEFIIHKKNINLRI